MAKICVIEDNIPIRKLFAILLKKSGYDVSDFGDGSSALDYLKSNIPDVILMDILLPDINGTELLTSVRGLPGLGNVKVIAITGFATNNDREKYLELGFTGYLPKPINTTTFVSDIQSILS